MEKRDFLKDQIEQMGKVLARILADFMGLKTTGDISRAIASSQERFQNELNIDIAELSTLQKDELKDYLTSRKLTGGHLEIIAQYLKEIGEESMENNEAQSKFWLEKAIEILDLSDEVSQRMSFERIALKEEIEGLMK